MNIAETLLPEFDHEMANTRIVLERVPDDKLTWKPHPRAGIWRIWRATWPLSQAGAPILSTPTRWIIPATSRRPRRKSRAQILAAFDKGVVSARAALAGATDEKFMQNWSLSANGQTFFTMPRIAVLRSFVMKPRPSIIARQLACILRLNDIPVPPSMGRPRRRLNVDEGSM